MYHSYRLSLKTKTYLTLSFISSDIAILLLQKFLYFPLFVSFVIFKDILQYFYPLVHCLPNVVHAMQITHQYNTLLLFAFLFVTYLWITSRRSCLPRHKQLQMCNNILNTQTLLIFHSCIS